MSDQTTDALSITPQTPQWRKQELEQAINHIWLRRFSGCNDFEGDIADQDTVEHPAMCLCDHCPYKRH